jgi:alpha-L-fucosidase 2
MYNARGWTMHHVTDPFGRTGLMDGIQWGTSPLAGAWMALTFWRHYEFSQDKSYLKTKAYPIMKGAVQFILDFLIKDKKGQWVTVPSVSPENAFLLPDSKEKHQLTYASTIDIQIIKELFNACFLASEILGEDPDLKSRIKNVSEKLPAIQVGKDGTIQEWIEDYQEAEPGHRHMSHMFGLHPGTQITPETPELFKAAQKTVEKRLAHGGGHTGWSRAWIINFYARLLNAEGAYKHVLALLRKSTLPNLFDNHPPFQIDGNFGGSAGIAEMLLKSHNQGIHILPALPKAWNKGFVKGLKARGNFEIDIFWEENKLKSLTIKSLSGGKCRIRYQNNTQEMDTRQGEIYPFDGKLNLM